MAPVVEILKAKATDAWRTDGVKSVQGVVDILKKTPGFLSVHAGTESQDPSYWYAFIVWESVQRHQALIDNKDVYPQLMESLLKGASEIAYMFHAGFDLNGPDAALNAPITEIAVWTLKEGTDKKKFSETLNSLITRAASKEGKVYPGGWGPVVEDEKKFAILLGWNSLEEFKAIVGADEKIQELIGELRELADIDLKHVVLTKH